MNVKLRVLTAGVLFFTGQAVFAQENGSKDKKDKETKIEEVVVLGYSKTATKAKSTAASTTISAETLENRPNSTFLNSIQGTAPGMSVNSNSGSPGSGKIDIMIRGLGSLNASADPLYVIDGLSTSATQFRNLNPNDIESLSILRDAQATSIYGNRGANGVIVITTKTGKFNSGLRLSYDALTSFSTYPKTKYNMANAKEFLQISKNYGSGKGASMTQDAINNYATDTDWTKEFMRTGISQQHNLALQAGGENISLYSSLGYLNNEGVIKGTDFQRFTFRNNITGSSKDKRFNYAAMLSTAYSRRNQLDQEENSGINNNSVQNVLFGTLLSDPSIGAYPFKNGREMYNTVGSNSAAYRPWVLYDNLIGGIQNRYEETTINGNFKTSYKFTDHLTIGNRTGIDYRTSDRTFARAPLGYLSSVVSLPSGATYAGIETLSNTKDFNFNTVTNITYNQQFGEHDFTVGVYMDYMKSNYFFKSQTQNGLDPLLWKLGAGTGYIPFSSDSPAFYGPTVSANKVTGGTLAYFATLDYDYAGKYGVSGVVRRDASYRFTGDNKWETFWSIGGRWNIDKESFMSDSKFRMLKLRASYGTQGNQNLGVAANNQNPMFLFPNYYNDVISATTPGVGGYQNTYGYLFRLGNPFLQWEKQSMANIGLDFNYNGIIEGTIDVYRKLTSNLFNGITVSAGVGSNNPASFTINGNNGEMENRGIEGSLKGNIIRKQDLRLSVFANAGYNKNKIKSLPNESLVSDNVNAIGGPAAQWQLYHYVGVNHETGEQQFLDRNGNITEAPTANDRVLTGKSIYPKLTGGFGFDLDYKGFFANALFTFQTGGWQYDNLYQWAMNPQYAANGLNVSRDLLNAWTPDNKGSDIPSLRAENAGSVGSSDRFLYKTDFIRLKNVSIGYSFTKSMLQNLPIRSLKLFVQAENLYTWSDWRGYDPEPVTRYSLGVYPNPKTVSVGVNVEF
ncbi:SusC/RagA family TonB-linked outer membrane protein [Chryseobacterium lactis]|uniref:SusC/RagA family TonB-linked outer membrane protein n=1 Tax=Chryseobacterium lactis TaxID=1241981 RepID=UPI001627FA29|nr:SusC/RagA family TonB-linked outer membrane protein [Chryseobacterium lactis]